MLIWYLLSLLSTVWGVCPPPSDDVGTCADLCSPNDDNGTDCFPNYECCANSCGGHSCVCTALASPICAGDPCAVGPSVCASNPAAVCQADYCGGCNRLWLFEGELVSGCEPCPEGVDYVYCFASPCSVGPKTCASNPDAVCRDDYCGGCNRVWMYNGEEVEGCEPCPPGVEFVQCLVSPCSVGPATCASNPYAVCEDDYCGGCNRRWFFDGEPVKGCEPCPDGVEEVECTVSPCSVGPASCESYPDAVCQDDYCGGCNRRWLVDGEPVDGCEPCAPGVEYVHCVVPPCSVGPDTCEKYPTAVCRNSYCGGCNRVWIYENEIVKPEECEPNACRLCPDDGDSGCPDGLSCCGCAGPDGSGWGTCLSCCAGLPCPPPNCEPPTCEKSHYFDDESRTCQPCLHVEYCEEEVCEGPSESTCVHCEDGYNLEEGHCVPNQIECQLCPDPGYVDPCPHGQSCCGCGDGAGVCAELCTLGCPIIGCPPKVCKLCPITDELQCPEGTTCCGCGTEGTCVENCTETCDPCAQEPHPEPEPLPQPQPVPEPTYPEPTEPQTCDICLSRKHQVCEEGSVCCGCSNKGVCSTHCDMDCPSTTSCPDDSTTFQVLITVHLVNTTCDDSKIADFIAAVEAEAKKIVGQWPGGTITANLFNCENNEGRKRDGQNSVVGTRIYFQGPYASVTATAVGSEMQDAVILGNGVSGQWVRLENPDIVTVTTSEDTDLPAIQVQNDDGLSGGAIAGIVIGSIVAASVVVAIAVAFYIHSHERMFIRA